MEPAVSSGKEEVHFFISDSLVVHTVTHAVEYLACNFVDNDPDDSQHNPQPPLKTIVKSSPDMKGKIKHVFADLDFLTKSTANAMLESRLTKWTFTLELKI